MKAIWSSLGAGRIVAVAFALAVALGLFVFINGQAVAGKEGAPPADSAVAWTLRCQPQKEGAAADDKKSCEIFQRLVVKESLARVAEFAIGFPEGSEIARGVIVLPLGILLQPGVEMRIDDGKPYAFKIRYCTEAGCFAYVNLDKDLLETMRKGTSANFAFKAADGKDVNLSMTLSGFGTALKGLT